MIKLLLAAALVAQGIATSANAQARGRAQNRAAGDIRITRAVYGAKQGSADVTPVVTSLAQPGLDEFYAAPRWLELDPAVNQGKHLVIFYEYRGEPRVLTTTEFGAVSHTILIEHADPETRRQAVANDTSRAVALVHAYYGWGRTFQDVTTRVSQIIRPASGPVIVSDSAMMLRPTQVGETLIITYSYRGARNTLTVRSGERVTYEALASYAENGGHAQGYSASPPAWLQDATPAVARAPGNPGPGSGRAGRRELGIVELLKASAELEEIGGRDKTAAVIKALAATKSALADAQLEIGYPYPPPTEPRPKALGPSTVARLANAARSLTAALDYFSAANPGRGRAAGATKARTIAAINEALAALR
jgi:hypothetical protein